MEKVIITGGTGAIGLHLTKLLVANFYEVIIFTRNPNAHPPQSHVRYVQWDPKKQIIDSKSIQEADYIINLAGANLNASRWTKSYQQEIISSRVESGQLIYQALKQIPNQVKAVLSASAIGWYGADDSYKKKPFEEGDPQGGNFLSWVCNLWEASVKPIETLGTRLVVFRFGVVISKDQGLLKEVNRLLRFRLNPIFGSGKQMLSWIHIDDLCRMFLFAMQNNTVSGLYNACASDPMPIAQFTKRFAKRRYGLLYLPFPIPEVLIKLLLGKKGQEMVLQGTWVSNKKIVQENFPFKYPVLDNNCIDNLHIG
ncbi:TIGR01777 family protein [Sphingobacterium sp. N143]|uniref:TIGR01777 family oxidoreductase n=1 Tax=Sphingobacterium sp. N143 TaxID=2746727 RepID=UPI002577110C|nr:TIGR01777 family oxidoreductase [Sphingobacterium sp. N143]MDM1293152.1 TIGR01777 family protein [Sphingobacterium sp. N143]